MILSTIGTLLAVDNKIQPLKIHFDYNLATCMTGKKILYCLCRFIYRIHFINIYVKFTGLCKFLRILQIIRLLCKSSRIICEIM